MGWVRIDDRICRHPKFAGAGPLALAMQVAGLAYCNEHLTDGFIPHRVARTLLDFEGLGEGFTARGVIALLLAWDIWGEVEHGYLIHDYLEYQPSRSQVLAEREERRLRAKKAAGQRWHGAESNEHANSNAQRMPDACSEDADCHAERNAKTMLKNAPNPNPNRDRDKYMAPTKTSEPKTAANGQLVVLEEPTPPARRERARSPDDLEVAFAKVTNTNLDELTKHGRGGFYSALAEIRKAGATPEAVMSRAITYRRQMPEAKLSAPALAKHWATLGGDPTAPRLTERDLDSMAWVARKQSEEAGGGP